MLFFLYSIESLEFVQWEVNLGTAAAGCILWILKSQKKKVYVGAGTGILAAVGLAGLAVSEELRRELSEILQGVLGSLKEGPREVTEGGIFLGILLLLAGFVIEEILHAHWILYLAVTILLLTAPLLGHAPGNFSVFLMTVFQLSFWAMTGVRKLSSPAADNLNNKIRIGVFCGFGGIFAAACLITNVSEESLYQAAYEAEGRIQRTVKQITGADMSSTDGTWSMDNQRYKYDIYGFRYFQQDEMDIQWDNIQPYFSDNGATYQEVQDAYIKEAAGIYTQVPEEEIPRLTRLCRENPMEDLEHITTFILYTLQSNASYTRTPGMFPFNEDPVEYFLFQGQEGYCQHFASAAVLMYRLYGVPARYATGYAVSPSAFQEQADGTYRAVVTDESAHAWPEIFIRDYGWTPVEVTPMGEGITAGYPGFDTEIFQNIMTDTGWDLSLPSLRVQEEDTEDISREEKKPVFSWEADQKSLWIGLTIGTAVFIVLSGFFYRRYKRRDQWIQKGGMGRLFDQLLFDLHFSGIMREYQGWERDFYSRLSVEIPAVSLKEAEQIVRAAREESFGNPEKPRQESFQAAYGSCLKIRNTILNEMKTRKRLIYYPELFTALRSKQLKAT